jgi:hypothetical protein
MGFCDCPDRKALEEFSPGVLRVMFALANWEKPMTYTEDTAREAKGKLDAIKSFFMNLEVVLTKFGPGGSHEGLSERWEVSTCTHQYPFKRNPILNSQKPVHDGTKDGMERSSGLWCSEHRVFAPLFRPHAS